MIRYITVILLVLYAANSWGATAASITGSTAASITGSTAATIDTTPTVSSLTIGTDGETVTAVFSKSVERDNYVTGDLSLDCVTAGDPVNLAYASGDPGATWTFTAASTINSSDSCTADYTGTNDLWVDADSLGTDWTRVDSHNYSVDTTGSYRQVQQNDTVLSGVTYVLDYTISNRTAGGITTEAQGVYGGTRVTNGRFQDTLTPTSDGYVKWSTLVGGATLDLEIHSVTLQ